ncbi:MAG TPA: hypothetical protein VNZ54_07985 [bacterium]|nr:hypothetical protein [bacterium]
MPASFTPKHLLLLAAIVAVGLGLRLSVALRAPWFWDEGYVVEAAQCLSHGERPQVSGMWEDGFFPLSTSVLAPASAAPLLAMASGPDAMLAARIWAVLLQGLAMVLLAWLGLRLAGPGLGLAAAGIYAVMSFSVAHGGRAFYHHLAVVFLLAALLEGLGLFEDNPGPTALARASLWSGLAAAVAYWLWCVPLVWVGLLLWKRPPGWAKALPWVALAPLVVLVTAVAPDPAGAAWSVRSLLWTSGLAAPQGWAFFTAAFADLKGLPFLVAGLAGMVAAAWRGRGAWPWLALITALAVLEPIRQRGDISGISYPFQLAAPLAALGAAWLAVELWRAKAWALRPLALAPLALALWPVKTAWMNELSFAPEPVEDLAAYLDVHARPGDGICGMPEFNWRLEPRLRACDPFAIGPAEGRAAGFYLPGAPASRLAWPCGVAQLRYAVVSRAHVLSVFRTTGVPLSFLEMERQGWPKVFDNGTFRLYENPAFGAAPSRGETLLSAAEFYRYAAVDAAKAGRPEANAYALAKIKALEAAAPKP